MSKLRQKYTRNKHVYKSISNDSKKVVIPNQSVTPIKSKIYKSMLVLYFMSINLGLSNGSSSSNQSLRKKRYDKYKNSNFVHSTPSLKKSSTYDNRNMITSYQDCKLCNFQFFPINFDYSSV